MSDVIKSGFVSFSEQKKTIQVIDNSNPQIVKSTVQNTNEIIDEDLLQIKLNQELAESKKNAEERGYQEGYAKGYEEGSNKGQENGYEEGFQSGQEDGMAKARDIIEEEKVNLREDYESRKNELIKTFEAEKEALEPKFLKVIADIVQKMVGHYGENPDTILYLIRSGINEIDIHGDLTIKVSVDDFDTVIEAQDELTETLSQRVGFEILKDLSLKKNECIIETQMGTIDCSLGTRMDGLLHELELIRESIER